eukprot:4145433-Pyramimonas_sp.AAC.1
MTKVRKSNLEVRSFEVQTADFELRTSNFELRTSMGRQGRNGMEGKMRRRERGSGRGSWRRTNR